MENEEDDMKVARHLMHFKEDRESNVGEPEEDETDTGSTEVEPEPKPPWEPSAVRSHSKSQS